MFQPNCSIIIPTYNRLADFKKCLNSLLNLSYPNYEIIIVNDASTDNTQEFLDQLENEKIKVIHHSVNQGISASRNTGIKNASYDIVAFTDDDCTVAPDWLSKLLQSFSDSEISFAWGQTFYIKPDYKGYFPERLVHNLNARWPMSGNIAWRKKAFETIGHFDESLTSNEDSEIAIRAVAHNLKHARQKDAHVFHNAVNWTPCSLLKSAHNLSVWPKFKKQYPKHYLHFNPPVKFGWLINGQDYLYILFMPLFVPLLLIRYLWHGKRNLKIFFCKWPILIFLRRYYIYKSAIKNKVFML